jgi:hypothetical protein
METILDGNPAVSATPYADLAIFRAIINGKNIQLTHTSGFGTNADGTLEFRVSSEEVLENAEGKDGYVYVFHKKDFEPYNRDGKADEDSMEWRSYKMVKPIEVIKVHSEDLPKKDSIEITER